MAKIVPLLDMLRTEFRALHEHGNKLGFATTKPARKRKQEQA